MAKDTIVIHAPTNEIFTCTQSQNEKYVKDCLVQAFTESDGRLFLRAYLNDGYKNEDWFGYEQPVLAPCDCIVVDVFINPVENVPGIITPGIASSITFKKADGTLIKLAHVKDVIVNENQFVKAGCQVAKIGNNGFARNPGVSISASRGPEKLQVRFKQQSLATRKKVYK